MYIEFTFINITHMNISITFRTVMQRNKFVVKEFTFSIKTSVDKYTHRNSLAK